MLRDECGISTKGMSKGPGTISNTLLVILSSGVRKRDGPVVVTTVCNAVEWNSVLVLLHISLVTSHNTQGQAERTLGCSDCYHCYA